MFGQSAVMVRCAEIVFGAFSKADDLKPEHRNVYQTGGGELMER